MGAKRKQISILVVCKRTVDCELYSQALNRHSGFRVATTATSADEALQQLEGRKIDVMLVSTTLGDDRTGALSLLQKIRDRCPAMRSVLLFDRNESDLVVPAFRVGARGVFCTGQDAFKNLCRCVERVHAGQIWANSAQLTQVLDMFSRLPVSRLVSAKGRLLLTKREEDIVRLVAEGCTNRDIAHYLHLSEHTVRNNLIRVFDKLGVSTRVELALYAVNNTSSAPASGAEGSERSTYELRDVAAQPIRPN